MKTLATLGLALCAAGAQSYAANLDGKLMDATCYNEKKVASQEAGHKTYQSITKTCAPTAATTVFAVRVESPSYFGETLKLDEQGNSIAADAMRTGSLPADNDGRVHVFVKGKTTSSDQFFAKAIKGEGRRQVENTTVK